MAFDRKRRMTSEDFKEKCFPYPNAYGWWRMGRAPDEDDSIEAIYEAVKAKLGKAHADTYVGPLLKVDRTLRRR